MASGFPLLFSVQSGCGRVLLKSRTLLPAPLGSCHEIKLIVELSFAQVTHEVSFPLDSSSRKSSVDSWVVAKGRVCCASLRILLQSCRDRS